MWIWKVQLVYFLDKLPENEILLWSRKDYKWMYMHIPTPSEHNGVYWQVFCCFPLHVINLPNNNFRCAKQKSISLFLTVKWPSSLPFFSSIDCSVSSLGSDTIHRTSIKGCWIIKNIHICTSGVSNSKTNCLVHTWLDLCDTVQANFGHLLIALNLFNAMLLPNLIHSQKLFCTCPCFNTMHKNGTCSSSEIVIKKFKWEKIIKQKIPVPPKKNIQVYVSLSE